MSVLRDRCDRLAARATALASVLTTADCPDTPLSDWALRDLAHHLGEAERLIQHLNNPNAAYCAPEDVF